MKDIDIEGELHWSGKERLIVLLGGLGILIVCIVSIWWFNSYIPVQFIQALWFLPNAVAGFVGLSCMVCAMIPRQTLWLMDLLCSLFP